MRLIQIVLLLLLIFPSYSFTQNIVVREYTSNDFNTSDNKLCEADFNRDGFSDVVILNRASKSSTLAVLLSKNALIYEKYTLYNGDTKNLQISCQYIDVVNTILTDKGNRVYKKLFINSHAIKVIQAESSQSIYYWKDGKFIQSWLSD